MVNVLKEMGVRHGGSSGPARVRRTRGAIDHLFVGIICVAVLVVLVFIVDRLSAAAPSEPRRVVILIGEDEYKTWETLPAFAERELAPRGYKVRVIQQDTADKHRFPGLVEALTEADLLIVSVRRRSPPTDQLDAIRRHLGHGKPLLAIRTASHAFAVRGADQEELAKHPERAEWLEFDREVLGGNYSGHHGAGPITTITLATGGENHPIAEGLEFGEWRSEASLYKSGPIVAEARALLIGEIPGRPPEPVAWIHLYGGRKARVFYTSLGHESDFANPQFRRLLVNAVAWGLEGE